MGTSFAFFAPMRSAPLHFDRGPRIATAAPCEGAKGVYNALIGEAGPGLGTIDQATRAASRAFVGAALGEAAHLDSGIPDDPRLLSGWLAHGHRQTTAAYRRYLDGRRAGEPRRFFRNRSHALHFVQAVAPTKLVDGAWLYGLLPRWSDARLAPLTRIYLEELGDGVPSQHHVLLYRKLLASHGRERWHDLDDDHHVQGAIQLSLAHHAVELLPEVIGFNLGYEQLPLHLPITAYELNELGVDPYYFSLHVTIDNASTGHGHKSLQCALECLPRAGDAAEFYRRLVSGFKLNDLGVGTMEAIASFDLDRELNAVLAAKASIGAELHSDYCRIAGRTVTEWLTTPGGMPGFLRALVGAGWIRRGAEPVESRFWRLLHDDRAPMFGVFDDYEKQLIGDWIVDAPPSAPASATHRGNVRPFRRPRATVPAVQARPTTLGPMPGAMSVGQAIRRQLEALSAADAADEDVRFLTARLADVDDAAVAVERLHGFLSPANHTSPAGLLATRIVSASIGP